MRVDIGVQITYLFGHSTIAPKQEQQCRTALFRQALSLCLIYPDRPSVSDWPTTSAELVASCSPWRLPPRQHAVAWKPSSKEAHAMHEAPKKVMPMHRLCDKLADARALVTTVELALGSIHQDSTPQDAEDVRMVAHMLTKRLRKIERHFFAHHQATMRKAFPEVRHD
jgi:hypothetical protein